MASILDKFNKTSVGSSGTIGDYTDNISSSGDFKRIKGINVILNSWNKILRCQFRTVDHDPVVGCGLYKCVFEPADEITQQTIEDAVRVALLTYDDRAVIENIQVYFLTGKRGFVVEVVAKYNDEVGTIEITFDEESTL